jgi:hypothetical protein
MRQMLLKKFKAPGSRFLCLREVAWDAEQEVKPSQRSPF